MLKRIQRAADIHTTQCISTSLIHFDVHNTSWKVVKVQLHIKVNHGYRNAWHWAPASWFKSFWASQTVLFSLKLFPIFVCTLFFYIKKVYFFICMLYCFNKIIQMDTCMCIYVTENNYIFKCMPYGHNKITRVEMCIYVQSRCPNLSSWLTVSVPWPKYM